jgi:hypothetical protein
VLLPSELAQRVRPIRPGVSVGTIGRVGTLGLVVRRRGDGRPLFLSSSHVLSRRPDGYAYPVYQPGGRDRRPGDAPVATTVCYVKLSTRTPNVTEAALAEPRDPNEISSEHPLGPVRVVCERLRIGQRLIKVGRSTGLVRGRVIAIEWQGSVRFKHGRAPFAGQVLIEGDDGEAGVVSRDGDSGSVWLTEDGEAAALNFAAIRRGTVSVSTPIARVFERLGVTLFDD